MAQKILVTGGAGYIGAHVCKTLESQGYIPVVLDNMCTGRRDFVRWGPFVEASVDDTTVVRQVVEQHGIVAAIDMAGSIEVAESVADPLKYYNNNFSQKLAFLSTMRACGVKAIVFSSTAAVYGEPQFVPIPEGHPLQPKNPYGWSKRMVEQLLADFNQAGGPAWTALRYFNAAGASEDGDIGECHEPESHLIPKACLAVLGKLPALEIFGNDYPTPDGTAIRDYVHVMDIASAHVLAIRRLLEGGDSGSYNIGTGVGTSVGEILSCFAEMGKPVPHRFSARRAGDPARLVADSSQLRAQLGWRPVYTSVSDIVRTAYAWHQAVEQKCQ